MLIRFVAIFFFVTTMMLSVSFAVDEFNIVQSGLFWIVLPATAITVIVIISLASMLSHAFNMPQLEAWAKIEFREFIIGVILSVIVLSIFLTPDLISILTGTPNFVTSSINTLTVFRDNYLLVAYTSTIYASHELTLLTGYRYIYPISFLYFSHTDVTAPFTGVGTLLLLVSHAAAGLSTAIMVYNSTIVLLEFFLVASVLLLPFALSLRLIPFSRRLGTTMIALCVGAYIFLPFSVFLVSQFHTQINLVDLDKMIELSSSELNAIHLTIPIGFGDLCKNDAFKLFTSLPGEIWGIISGISYCIPSCAGTGPGYAACYTACFASVWSYTVYHAYPFANDIVQLTYGTSFYLANKLSGIDAGIVYNIIHEFLKGVNSIVLLSYINVLVIGIITYVGIRSVSTALGGEYMLPAIQKLI